MKKEDYEKLSELERMIYDQLSAAFMENRYTLELVDLYFKGDGYASANFTICGMKIRCAINEKRYVAWFCGDPINNLLDEVPHLVRKVVAQAKRMMKDKEVEYLKERIKELKEELKKLENLK